MAGGCGSQDQGQGRFEALADHVAAIDVPLHPAAGARRTGAETGLRPAPFSPVKLAVMDPHDMWDARDDFHFVWKRMTGNFILSARASFMGAGVEAHRKLGWTIRPSLETNGPHVTAALHGDYASLTVP